jgi:hypothetical protein
MPVFGCLLVLFFMMQFGLAGRWITFPKGREGFFNVIIGYLL